MIMQYCGPRAWVEKSRRRESGLPAPRSEKTNRGVSGGTWRREKERTRILPGMTKERTHEKMTANGERRVREVKEVRRMRGVNEMIEMIEMIRMSWTPWMLRGITMGPVPLHALVLLLTVERPEGNEPPRSLRMAKRLMQENAPQIG